jgi:hypothetical protein
MPTVMGFKTRVTEVFKKAGLTLPKRYSGVSGPFRDKWIDLFWEWMLGDYLTVEDFVKERFGLGIYL